MLIQLLWCHATPATPDHHSQRLGCFLFGAPSHHLCDFMAMGQGVSLNYPACLPELLPNGWSSITVQQPAFWDWTYPWWTVKAEDAHTGFTAGKRLSPDIAGAGALGAAEAGPGRSLARWGMGKGMAMSWARGKLLNAHCSPVGLTQAHATLDTAMAPWPKRDRVGSKWCLF